MVGLQGNLIVLIHRSGAEFSMSLLAEYHRASIWTSKEKKQRSAWLERSISDAQPNPTGERDT